jgi:ABC-type glycerol-3-phosphate transport system permease component
VHPMTVKLRRTQWYLHLPLMLLVVLTLYPFVFMIFTSLKDNGQFYGAFWVPTWPLHGSNYADAFQAISSYIWNSVVVTLLSTAGTVVIIVPPAYVFAHFNFKLREPLFYLIIMLLFIPALLTLVPLFLEVKALHLLDSRWALILPYIAGSQVLGIMILRNFFSSQPRELYEAAEVDGAGDVGKMLRIGVPLALPVIGTIAIFTALNIWGDYLWPLVALPSQKNWTMPLGLVNFQNTYVSQQLWGPLFAGYVIAAVPMVVLFLLLMDIFIRGLTEGALKA